MAWLVYETSIYCLPLEMPKLNRSQADSQHLSSYKCIYVASTSGSIQTDFLSISADSFMSFPPVCTQIFATPTDILRKGWRPQLGSCWSLIYGLQYLLCAGRSLPLNNSVNKSSRGPRRGPATMEFSLLLCYKWVTVALLIAPLGMSSLHWASDHFSPFLGRSLHAKS